MSSFLERLSTVKNDFHRTLSQMTSLKDIESVRITFLGKKGIITELLQELKQLSLDDKRQCGPLCNQLKLEIEAALEQAKQDLLDKQEQQARLKERYFDVSASWHREHQGHLHPYTTFVREIEDIFISMGYEFCDGPELETDFNNFTALNIPSDHPAREMYDTFWTNYPDHLMRTHTSPVQVRMMQQRKPPFAIIAPGRVYRHEAVDASHDVTFMQCEGLFIGEGVNLSHLFGTAQHFLQALFNKKELDIRIRPGFFPFVEPGVEIDMRCQFCTNGCSVCKKTCWMEVFPGGMVHPEVLRMAGIDPEKYSAFAFGFGLSRLAMLKYGIDDIRLLLGGKIKFLEQF